MSSETQNILLVGAGKMGGAMLKSWIEDPHLNITVLDPNLTPTIRAAKEKGAIHIKSVEDLPSQIDIIVLAIKPQLFETVVSDLKNKIPETALAISVLAGTSLKRIEHYFPNNPVVRAMPNTPASIGKGITAITGNERSTPKHQNITQALLSACGKIRFVDNEDLINAVTAISGSGPAYIFYFAEALTEAAKNLGLAQNDAEAFAREMIIGAGALLEQSSETAADLRRNVTSPNGTTQAALDILMSDQGLLALVKKATQAAYHRAQELAQE